MLTVQEMVVGSDKVTQSAEPVKIQEKKAVSERDKSINEITRDILKLASVVPAFGNTYDRVTWRFVHKFVNSRMRPEYTGKTVTASDPLSERMARLLKPNTRTFTTAEEEKSGQKVFSVEQKENYVIRKYKTNAGKYIAEIIYGCGETENDELFLKTLYGDPQKFLLDNDLPVNSQIKITLKYPSDIPFNQKIVKIASEGMDNCDIAWEGKHLPLTFGQVVTIDRETDKGKYMESSGRVESYRRLEIRLPTVEKAVKLIIERLGDKSKLKKILESDFTSIAKQIYENIKIYKNGNLASVDQKGEEDYNAVGAIFEACVSCEIANDGLDDMISDLTGTENISVQTGGGIFEIYRRYASSRFVSHPDGLIIANNSQKKETIGLIECKLSASDHLSKSVFSQITNQVKELCSTLSRIIDDDGVTVKQPREMFVIIIKPNRMFEGKKEFNTISPMLVVGESRAYIIRSGILYEDLEIARAVFNESVGIKTKKQASETSEA